MIFLSFRIQNQVPFFLLFLFSIVLWSKPIEAVERHKYKTCEQSAPCSRYRKFISYQNEKKSEAENESSGEEVSENKIEWNVARYEIKEKNQELYLILRNKFWENFIKHDAKDLKNKNKFRYGEIIPPTDLIATLTFYDSRRLNLHDDLRRQLKYRHHGIHESGFLRIKIKEDKKSNRYDLPKDFAILDSKLDEMRLLPSSLPCANCVEVRNVQNNKNISENNNNENYLNKKNYLEIIWPSELTTRVQIETRPFRLHLISNDNLLLSLNSEDLFNYEVQRENLPISNQDINPTNIENISEVSEDDGFVPPSPIYTPAIPLDASCLVSDGLWSESFHGFVDHKRDGPMAHGIDVMFHKASTFYGLPEHTGPFALRPSSEYSDIQDKDEPYRFFNLDVFEYEIDTPMGLYGAIPLLVGVHFQDKQKRSQPQITGVLSVNPSESFVHLGVPQNETMKNLKTMSWWMSETGTLDMFLFHGQSPRDITRLYYKISGTPMEVPMRSLGYHQCRWNYNDQDDVLEVNEEFDDHGLPMDYIWLDIEHSPKKKYFLWDDSKFPNTNEMLQELGDKKRNMVVIVDPHVKNENGYAVHDSLSSQGAYLMKPDGTTVYDGWCWPGNSKYPDFLDPKVRSFYGSFFESKSWKGTGPIKNRDKNILSLSSSSSSRLFSPWESDSPIFDNVDLWNDMNEPSVFNGPEVTTPRDVLHKDGTEHRSVHNAYALGFSMATYDGMMKRSPKKRSFILTRAFFVGSQRYAAMWTGDNWAHHKHFRYSIPMILSLAVAGYSNTGADIGGFFKSPSESFLTRWTQLGIWYPFMRNHAHIESLRREPYLLEEPYFSQAKLALRLRYKLLPFWYTHSMAVHIFGVPLLSSISEFEMEENKKKILNAKTTDNKIGNVFWSSPDSFTRDDGFVVADTFFIRPQWNYDQPISTADSLSQLTESFVLPGLPTTQWFSYPSLSFAGSGGSAVSLTDNTLKVVGVVPSFVKSGSIIFTKERSRRSSEAMRFDPYTITAFLTNSQPRSHGILYLDDYISVNQKSSLWISVTLRAVTPYQLVMNISRVKNDLNHMRTVTSGTVERLVIVHNYEEPLKNVTVSKLSSNIVLPFEEFKSSPSSSSLPPSSVVSVKLRSPEKCSGDQSVCSSVDLLAEMLPTITFHF